MLRARRSLLLALTASLAAHFDLIVDLKTAKALGIKIPPLVLVGAARVIE